MLGNCYFYGAGVEVDFEKAVYWCNQAAKHGDCIAKQMLDLTGGIDFNVLNKAVSSIKALGVKEHLAQQKANAEKQKASVPTGQAVTSGGEALTREYAIANYAEAVKKYGMEKVDAIIMKG